MRRRNDNERTNDERHSQKVNQAFSGFGTLLLDELWEYRELLYFLTLWRD
jgi:hypothetical protein